MKHFFRTCMIACLLACFVLTSAQAAIQDEDVVIGFLNEEEELSDGVQATVGELDELIETELFVNMMEGILVIANNNSGMLAFRPDDNSDKVWFWMVDLASDDTQTPGQYLAATTCAIASVCEITSVFVYNGDIVGYFPSLGSGYVDEEGGVYGDIDKFAEKVIMLVVS